jgi:peptide/nickel transport system permease protein
MSAWLTVAGRGAGSTSGKAGLALFVVLLGGAVFIAIGGPDPASQDLAARLTGPGTGHILGADHLGRDLGARVASAMLGSLSVAASVALLAGVGGGALGLASGYTGGWFDIAVQRVLDSLMALPLIVLALAVVAAAGPTKIGTIAALSLAFTPISARTARAAALTVKASGYVESARATGASPGATLLRHVLPNAAAPLAVVVSTQFGGALLAEASLSFLGAGQQPSLGAMLGRDAQVYMYASPWMVVWPGIALGMAAMAANLTGDAVAGALTSPGQQRGKPAVRSLTAGRKAL